MEAVGAVANIVSVVQLIKTVVTLCYKYQDGVRNAPKDIERIVKEVKSLQDVLEGLLEVINASHNATRSSTLNLLSAPDGPLKRCNSELEQLQEKLTSQIGGKKRLTWPFKEKELQKTLKTIESQKATISLTWTADHT